jgi:hypothetical protein
MQLPCCAKTSPETSSEPSVASSAGAVKAAGTLGAVEPTVEALAEEAQAEATGEAEVAPTASGSLTKALARAIPDHPNAPVSGGGGTSVSKGAPGTSQTAATEAEPAKPAEKIAWTSGPRQTDTAFAVWLEGPARVAPGAQASARVRVHANEPYKVNDKYPAKFTWDSTGALSVSDTTVRGLGISGKDGTLPLSFKPNQPGPLTLSGTLSFSVCTDANCRVEKRKLQLAIQAVP